MPFPFSYKITNNKPQIDLAFSSGVGWPTPTDESGQSMNQLHDALLFSKSATRPIEIP
jgi:hypothetical protein